MDNSEQDFSADTNSSGPQNKYGFSVDTNFPPSMFPGMPMPGYYPPYSAVNDNPLQELITLGYKDIRFTETSGTAAEPFGFVMKIEGIDKTFTGFGHAKKKARKAAAQCAFEFLCDPTNLPEETKEKSPKPKPPPYMHPMYPNPWGQMAPFPSRYPMPHSAPQYYHGEYNPYAAPMASSAPKPPRVLRPGPSKETPFSILKEKYPNAQIKTQATATVIIGEQEFSATLPGNNPHLSRMHACVSALKELEGIEFPEWDQRLERKNQNLRDPLSVCLHPVSVLVKEFGGRNVTFKHDLITEPCSVTINDPNESGNQHVFSSDVFSTKKQAKYEASLLAIKGLGLDKKYTNILAFRQEDRKRKLDETPADDVAVNELGEQLTAGLEVEPRVEPEEIAETDPPKSSPPAANEREMSPTPDKKMRTDPPEDKSMETESPSYPKRQESRAQSSRYPRGSRGSRSNRILIRGHRGQLYGAQRYY